MNNWRRTERLDWHCPSNSKWSSKTQIRQSSRQFRYWNRYKEHSQVL